MYKELTNKLKLVVSLSSIPLVTWGILYLIRTLNPGITSMSKVSAMVLNEVVFLSSFLIVILLFKDFFIRNISLLTKKEPGKYKKLFSTILESFALFMVAKYIIGLIVTLVLSALNLSTVIENQALVESYVDVSIPLLIISSCIFAPITEEFLFRGSLKEGIKNKWVFITVSGLIFGLVHVLDGYTLILGILLIGLYLDFIINKYKGRERVYLSICGVLIITLLCGWILFFQYGNLLNLITNFNKKEIIGSAIYISMGAMLAHFYYKYDNIWINIGVHALNNALGVIAILFL